MPTTIKNIKGTELPPALRSKFNVKENQFLTLTVEIQKNNEYDTINVGNDIIEGIKQVIAHKKGELDFPPAL